MDCEIENYSNLMETQRIINVSKNVRSTHEQSVEFTSPEITFHQSKKPMWINKLCWRVWMQNIILTEPAPVSPLISICCVYLLWQQEQRKLFYETWLIEYRKTFFFPTIKQTNVHKLMFKKQIQAHKYKNKVSLLFFPVEVFIICFSVGETRVSMFHNANNNIKIYK